MLPDPPVHLHGELAADLGANDVVVTCLVRNEAVFIPYLIEHYTALGARQIIFLDNDSQDATRTLIMAHPNTVLYHSTLPYREYETAFHAFLRQQVPPQTWNLYVDADEFFDFPYSDQLSLSQLVSYLNQYGYDAVYAPMLDLFADVPFSQLRDYPLGADLRQTFPYYDISHVSYQPYPYANQVTHPSLQLHFGGVRDALLNGSLLALFKHPLTCNWRQQHEHLNVHGLRGAVLADFSAVLLHYRFIPTLTARILADIMSEAHWNWSEDRKRNYQALHENPEFSLKTATARELKHVNQLVDEGLLLVSERYQAFVTAHSRLAQNPPPAP